VFTGTDKNENGLFVGPTVSVEELTKLLDEIVGKDLYALFPAVKISENYQWGVVLQGWPPNNVLHFVDQLKTRLGVLVEPFWDEGV